MITAAFATTARVEPQSPSHRTGEQLLRALGSASAAMRSGPVPTDAVLAARAAAGDAGAQRALYEMHVDRIHRLAFRMTGDEELARDITQDTFIRAFQRLGEFRGDSSIGTWLYAIGVSVALNGLRKVKRLRTRETAMDDADGVLTLAGGERRAEPDLKERMAAAIGSLPEGYRTVFLLHDVEGYTHEEIGTMLGIQSGTSKAQLSRARGKLREMLADFAGEWA